MKYNEMKKNRIANCQKHAFCSLPGWGFDHTEITGEKRETCTECGAIRWHKDGIIVRDDTGVVIMKPYMGFSRSYGAREGAVLIFAKTAKEARREGWRNGATLIADEYIDFGVRLLRNSDYLLLEADPLKLANGTPHVIDDPHSCKSCFMWGGSPIGEDGLCEDCRSEYKDKYNYEEVYQ